jgi:hypothetical protein
MKYFFVSILLLFWFVATIILTITIIGLAVVSDEDWSKIPHILLKVFSNDK